MKASYRVQLGPLLESHGASLPVQTDITMDPFVVGGEEFVPTGPVHVDVLLTNTGAGVVASGAVSVDLNATCSRCLRPFVLHATGEVEGFYVLAEHASTLPEDQDFELIESKSIDLGPALHAAIVVDLPMAPVHDRACKGICPHCGADLELGPCSCSAEPGPSPFSALKDLLEDER